MMKSSTKILSRIYIWLILIILYAPIVFIAVFSFTEAKSLGNWTGFSMNLYKNLFTGSMQNSSALLSAVENTLLIALIASLLATMLGTVAAIGIYNMKGRAKNVMTFLNNIPMINPDIITGVSLFLLFVFLHISQGYTTVVLAHITFCTPYVVLNVLPKLSQMNPNIYEAALDLGAQSDDSGPEAGDDIGIHPLLHHEPGRLCGHLLHPRNHRAGHAVHLYICGRPQGWPYP